MDVFEYEICLFMMSIHEIPVFELVIHASSTGLLSTGRTTRSRLLEAWLALTIGLEVSKPIHFYGS